ncbi:MAG: hypothetical protein ABI867_37965 [Kofleriaceae bacterium]
MRAWILLVVAAAACGGSRRVTTPREMPSPTIQVGACGVPERDGVIGAKPKLEHADRDLNGDGVVETIVVDRAICTAEANCYWNVFIAPAAGTQECSRYAGTFAGAALEPLAAKGDDNMSDVRGYWNLHGGRLSLESYRFVRGGYQRIEGLICMRGSDDKLECMDGR